MKALPIPSRRFTHACLSMGLIFLCCGLTMALTQTDGPSPAATTVNSARAKVQSKAELAAAHAEFYASIIYYRPAPGHQVMVKTRSGLYHWRQDCPLWSHPGFNAKSKHLRRMTRAQAEAQHYFSCGFCRELDEREGRPRNPRR